MRRAAGLPPKPSAAKTPCAVGDAIMTKNAQWGMPRPLTAPAPRINVNKFFTTACCYALAMDGEFLRFLQLTAQ
jgi:hypothetical protein